MPSLKIVENEGHHTVLLSPTKPQIEPSVPASVPSKYPDRAWVIGQTKRVGKHNYTCTFLVWGVHALVTKCVVCPVELIKWHQVAGCLHALPSFSFDPDKLLQCDIMQGSRLHNVWDHINTNCVIAE